MGAEVPEQSSEIATLPQIPAGTAHCPPGKAAIDTSADSNEDKAVDAPSQCDALKESVYRKESAPAKATSGGFLPPAPKPRGFAAPPPKFPGASVTQPSKEAVPAPHSLSALTPGEQQAKQARVLAIAAARAAAAQVTPGQRDRAIEEAASVVYGVHLEAAKEAAAREAEARESDAVSVNGAAPPPRGTSGAKGPTKDASTYSRPSWAGPPEGVNYHLEVLKDGAIVGKHELAGQDHFTLGRVPMCDIQMEHPSISRLHAVLQFRGSDAAPFVFDCSSTHGSFVNKRRVKPGVHVPLRVGDILRFGDSKRMFILNGPEELMPEEGLNKQQRLQASLLQAKEVRKVRDEEVAKAQMAAALNRGVSWGMADDDDDAAEPMDADMVGGTADWRAYADTQGLSDKQQKMADRIRRLSNRVANLVKESDRIRAKQTQMEELSAGQASTLARNETEIDKANEQIEELEETLAESVADALKGRKRREEPPKKRKRMDPEDEAAAGMSSDEDEFYDRTAEGGKKAKKEKKAVVEDAASLFGKKAALLLERQRLEKLVAQEEALLAGSNPSPAAAAAAGSDDAVDALDAFMTNVQEQMEKDKVGALRREIADIDAQITAAERLLKVADPDGYYKDGSAVAEAAKAKGIKALQVEKARKEAAEKQQKDRMAAKAKEREAALHFVPETEEEEGATLAAPPAGAPGVQAAPASSSASVSTAAAASDATAPQDGVGPEGPAPPRTAATPARSIHRLEADVGVGKGGLEVRARPPKAGPGDTAGDAAGPDGVMSRAQVASRGVRAKTAGGAGAPAKDTQARAEQAVMADLALLQGRGLAAEPDKEGADAAAEESTWVPPEGQKGDGRSRLNDLLGY